MDNRALMGAEKRRAEMIIDQIDNGECNLQIYASDGNGVRPVSDLLSESQTEELEQKVRGYLEDLISDIEETEYEK